MRPCIALVIALLIGVSRSQADEPWKLFDGCHWTMPSLQWRQRCCWCPDDYDCKLLPTVPCNATGCRDDYCAKPLPAVPCNAKGCRDDYCPRNCPLVLGNLREPWYRCVPTGDGAGPCQRCR
jgi:hypothetical protein